MNLNAARDEYCERLGPGLLAEPANALSNLAFFVAAYLLWRSLNRAYAGRPIPPVLRALPILIALIGAGSTAYHSFAVVWAEILDVLFIGVFIYFYVVCFLRYFAGLNGWIALLGVPGFWAFGWLVTQPFPPDAFNGSVAYFPALFGIALMGVYLAMTNRARVSRYFFASASVFLISLGFRSQDQVWCAHFPLGTHWIWHCLNAVTLSLVAIALIRDRSLRNPA